MTCDLLRNLDTVYFGLGDSHKALDTFRDVLPIRRELHDGRGEGAPLYYIGVCLIRLGDLDQALETLEEALPIVRQAGDRRAGRRALPNLGGLYLQIGESQEAIATFEQDLPLTRAVKHRGQEVSGALLHIQVDNAKKVRSATVNR